MKSALRHHARRLGRFSLYALAGALAVLAVVYGIAYALLPQIENKKGDLEEYLTRRAGHTVRIEKLTAYWDGLFPGVHIEGLNVYAGGSARARVRLAELHASFAPLALIAGQIDIHSLVLTRPSLALERLADGRLRVSGFDPAALEQHEGADEKLINWLLSQRRLAIRDGELLWVDRREGMEAMRLSALQFTLRNRGARHRAELSAQFPAALCRECALRVDITGNPFAGNDWTGEIYLRAAGLDVERLPRIAHERLPAELRGKFDVRLRSEWNDGMPTRVHGAASVIALSFPLAAVSSPLTLRQASGNVDWRADDDGWQLDLDQLRLALRAQPWAAERLRLTHSASERTLQIDHVDLADVSNFVSGLNIDHPLLRDWSALRPTGALDNLRIKITGDLHAPTGFGAGADLRAIGVQAHGALPGVRGVSGRVALGHAGGQLTLDSTDVELDLPRIFRGPLDAQRVAGRITWERAGDAWRVEGGDLRVTSADGNGTGQLSLTLPIDRAQSPQLALRVDFRDGNGAHAARYFPVHHLSPPTLAWMESAFLGGTVTRGYLIYDGPVRAWPFEQGGGRFEIRGHVRNGVYGYLPGWLPITNADVDVAIDGANVVVTGRGNIGTLDATQVAVRAHAAASGVGRAVAVTGKVHGPVAETLRVLTAVDAPTAGWRRYLPAGLDAEGAGSLSLNVNVALDPRAVHYAGEYRVNGALLRFPAAGVTVNGVSGHVGFTEAGVQEGHLTARVLGGDALVTIARGADGRLGVDGRGRIAAAAVARLHSAALADRVSGAAEWTAAWREKTGLGDAHFEAALDQIKTRLPAPLDRPDGWPIDKLTIHTELSRPEAHILDVRAGDVVRGKLAFANEGGWRFARGHLGFGLARVVLPLSTGLQVSARLDALDLDQWLPFSRAGDGAGAGPFAHVSAEVKQLDMFDRRWGRLFVDLTAADDGWRALIDGDAAAGRGNFTPARPGRPPAPRVEYAGTRIQLDLAYLRLPEKKHRGQDTPIDPAQLPAVDLRAGAFEYSRRAFGQIDFSAVPIEHGWRIARFNLARPDMTLAASGTWRINNNQRHTTDVNVDFRSSDMGKTAEALGAAGQLAGGKAEIRAHLAWPGSPTNPKLTGLDGRIEIAAEKGRFLQFDSGAARLFGLLDLSSIARYLTLDFTSAFGKGFTYDKIHGTVLIDDGNARTEDLLVKSPSAGLTAYGRVGLVTEDFDLILTITPQLSDTLTFTSWGLFGPQAAAAVLALQKLFRKQIAKGTQVTYTVKGPWKNPTVNKVVKPAAEKPPKEASVPAE